MGTLFRVVKDMELLELSEKMRLEYLKVLCVC